MEQERVDQALARIAAAAARIEAAAEGTARGNDDPELARKHAQLRATVDETLRELDALIGEVT